MRAAPGVIALLILGLTACQSSTGPELELQVVAEDPVVPPEAENFAQVAFTITNTGDEVVAVSRCGERIMTALDRLENGRWVQLSGDACLAVYSSVPLQIEPGQTVEGVRGLEASPGVYRLRIGIVLKDQSPRAWGTASNRFRIGS